MQLFRRLPESTLVACVLAAVVGCGPSVERVPVTTFTEGVETELVEVAPDEWRIADERVLPDTADTRVIARGLNGIADTFGLAELSTEPAPAAAATTQDSTEQRRYHRRSFMGPILLYGLIGNRLGGYRRGATPNAAAYTNRQTFDRVQNNAGTRLNRTGVQRTVSRPAGGRSGYGSGAARSGRSYGG